MRFPILSPSPPSPISRPASAIPRMVKYQMRKVQDEDVDVGSAVPQIVKGVVGGESGGAGNGKVTAQSSVGVAGQANVGSESFQTWKPYVYPDDTMLERNERQDILYESPPSMSASSVIEDGDGESAGSWQSGTTTLEVVRRRSVGKASEKRQMEGEEEEKERKEMVLRVMDGMVGEEIVRWGDGRRGGNKIGRVRR
ncbi:hypothetical protein BDZ91DRAFT_802064 [Kalaharituber pfeilii]|nr:hypothetical protein BDZ91DRAFT_802064 [Kalaharituber pfeilii]